MSGGAPWSPAREPISSTGGWTAPDTPWPTLPGHRRLRYVRGGSRGQQGTPRIESPQQRGWCVEGSLGRGSPAALRACGPRQVSTPWNRVPRGEQRGQKAPPGRLWNLHPGPAAPCWCDRHPCDRRTDRQSSFLGNCTPLLLPQSCLRLSQPALQTCLLSKSISHACFYFTSFGKLTQSKTDLLGHSEWCLRDPFTLSHESELAASLLLGRIPLYHSSPVHSPFGGHLGSFQFGVIMNNASVSTYVQVLVWTYVSFLWVNTYKQDCWFTR